MRRGKVGAVSDDRIDILLQLEPLVAVRMDNPMLAPTISSNIEHLERPVALVRTQLAMIGVIHATSASTPVVARRLELVELQLALVGGQRAQVVAHQADGGLAEVDELDPGHGAQQLLGRPP